MTGGMTEARVAALLAAYGADPARWPDAEREGAVAWLAAHNGALAQARTDAQALDGLLALDASNATPSDALVVRVLQSAPHAGENVVAFHAKAQRRWNAGALAALAACAVMGVVIGFSAASDVDDATADADAAFGAAFGVSGLPGSEG